MTGRPSSMAPGTVIGPYTAVGKTGRRLYAAVVWQWRCECGATHFGVPARMTGELRAGKLVCKHTVAEIGRPPRNLIGIRNGKLVVQEIARQERNREYVWWCECDCGARTTVRASRLRPGGTTMCGSCAAERRKTPDGYRIRDARTAAGLTLEEAGALCGVSKQRAEQWENQIRVADADYIVTKLEEHASGKTSAEAGSADEEPSA